MFFQASVKCFGHIVSENGVSTDIEKTRAVQDCDRTRTQQQMTGFLGSCSYYRKYVKNFAQIASPRKMYKDKVPTKMSKIFFYQRVFDIYFTELGSALTTVLPVLFKYCHKYCYSDSRNL